MFWAENLNSYENMVKNQGTVKTFVVVLFSVCIHPNFEHILILYDLYSTICDHCIELERVTFNYFGMDVKYCIFLRSTYTSNSTCIWLRLSKLGAKIDVAHVQLSVYSAFFI